MTNIDFGSSHYPALKNKKSSDRMLALLTDCHEGPPMGPHAAEEEVIAERFTAGQPEPADTARGRRRAFQRWIDSFEPLPENNRFPTLHAIKRVVGAEFNVTVLEIDSDRRNPPIVRARHVAMYLARELTPRSFPDIGRKFGRRDPTTVEHACQKIEALMKADHAFAELIPILSAKVQA
jgi:hypothetical protein